MRHIDTQTLWIQEKVRTKQITLKKVRGEVNPAYLLTKFLTGKDKLDQLIKLFGLLAMKGRAKSAPLFRKKKVAEVPEEHPEEEMEVCVLQEIDNDGVVIVPEAGRHDIEVWPQLHSEETQAQLFPTAIAVQRSSSSRKRRGRSMQSSIAGGPRPAYQLLVVDQ